MKQLSAARIAAAFLAVAGTTVALTLPAAADPTTATTPELDLVSPQMLSAMERDLGLTEAEARTRLTQEAAAVDTETSLKSSLGSTFAGARFDADAGKLVVGVTDSADLAEVRAAGAIGEVVDTNLTTLEGVAAKLDTHADSIPASITGWYVDVEQNTVVMTVADDVADSTEAGAQLLADAGLSSADVTVVESDEAPKTLYDVRGGDAYYFGGSRCSIGFSVNGGYVTAGHCGGVGTATQGSNRVASGSVAGSVFPGSDMGWVRTNSNWVPRGVVNRYNGGTVAVAGSTEAAIGASICRSGSTTGWRCGTIQAKNQTVNYAQGAVRGMTRTNACAEGGDSGGSWLSGSQAQGVTSGGSGNCSFGGTTYFQPVNPILSRYGLSLVRG
ncbi:S1 family peptidase [Actinoalloteichus hymeniacidonis]|uniref:Alpha-lytic protease proenzyme n=1 Tax=Actinoalloteichus hymeniacidonis TaxID=340345 RepID=A0AAC9MWQ0_9PSEU|nr:S1 family peptidase [Actinoalloteichus hymeniacidonis]AOS61261.1 Alpha-lytic protease proenzyme [Actinoalloteichus hymeniacidonis]MBB5910736.1 streptogrisin C [Actinoalloteichus hymeniacidonis]